MLLMVDTCKLIEFCHLNPPGVIEGTKEGISDDGDEEEEMENAKPGNGRWHPCDFPGCSKVYTRSRLEIFSEGINSMCTKISLRIFCPA